MQLGWTFTMPRRSQSPERCTPFHMTSKKSYYLIILGATFLISTLTFSQTDTNKLKGKIDSLKRSGIDTFLTYTPFQNLSSPDDKGKYLIVYSDYLIWSSNNLYYIQKFSDCLDEKAERSFDTAFKPIVTEHLEAYQYFLANIGTLKTVRLKPGMVKDRFDGKDTILKISSYHAPHTGVTIFTPENEITNSFSDDELYDGITRNTDGSTRAIRQSINYEFNKSTSIYKLTNSFQELINLYEKQNSFDNP